MESKTLDAALAAKNTATDGAYIMAQDANGNTIRIAKADLASVLAGSLAKGTLKANADTIKETSFYSLATDNNEYNVPVDHGVFICVYCGGWNDYVQIALERTVAGIWYRVCTLGETWTEWRQL